MIPELAITQWRSVVPWNDVEQVEQDLIICRALVAIFNDEFLAERLAFRSLDDVNVPTLKYDDKPNIRVGNYI